MLFFANEVVGKLQSKKIQPSLISLPTIKPLDPDDVLGLFARGRAVYVFEEHAATGGLGSAISEIVADRGLAYRVIRMGTKDAFIHVAGSRDYLLGLNDLTVDEVTNRIIQDISY